MGYRLGIDIGTNSLGWCVLDLGDNNEPTGIRDIGVRIFPAGRDPQSGTSLAVDRRTARSMRRRRDRYLLRRKDLMSALVRFGLMAKDRNERKALEGIDPYESRARGLDEPLSAHELGRAIFHLNQRRGFRSNRRTDRGDAKESGKIKAAGDRLEKAMAAEGTRTVGEYLWRRHKDNKPVRARLTGQGAKAEYEFYPHRAMLEDEFEKLWDAQTAFHPELTEQAHKEVHGILFRQRPLRPVDPGKCALDPAATKDDKGGMRAPWALPIAQRFRILQELANLCVVFPDQSERSITCDERDPLLADLLGRKKVSFKAMRKRLGLASYATFNLESDKRPELKGDETGAVLSKNDLFGAKWHDLDLEKRTDVVERLLAEEDEDALTTWLATEWGLNEEAARKVANASLPDGYCRLGRRALGKMVPILASASQEEVDAETAEVVGVPVGYAEAAREAGYHHSDRRPGDLLDKLPYYGEAMPHRVSGTGDPDDGVEARFGRIANPTVHIGLNQLRRLINALIEEYGRPRQVVVELARELKLGYEQKKRIEKEQAENKGKNDARREELAKLGLDDNGENRMKLRLWEELNPSDPLGRLCVYTGEPIGIRRLFSDEIEVEHILPFSRTLDNSAANRTVSVRRANREKGNSTPFEAFGADAERWKGILERAQGLPKNKRWRFAEDAMDRFEGERDFLDRQLTDTAYLSTVTREYLTHVCAANNVWGIPGRLTALLRGKWGLNSLLSDANLKNRVDHRHHAIDALVAGLSDRSILHRVASAAEQSRDRLIENMPEPWEHFRDQARDALRGIVVSYRPDHGAGGKLHEETAYGVIKNPEAADGYNLVYRKALTSLNENEIERIRNEGLRQCVRDQVYEAKGAGMKLKDALARFSEETGVRRVRLLKKEAALIEIEDADGRPYKAYIPGDNHHVDVFRRPDGSWDGEP